MNNAITVRYPTWEWYVGTVPSMATAPAWYDYLLAGLRELYDVRIEPDMDAMGRATYKDQYTAIRIEAGGRTWTAVYDWCDFPTVWAPPCQVDSYHKIMCREGMMASGVRPIGQTLAKMETLAGLQRLRALRADQGLRYDVSCLGRATNFDLRVQAVRALRQIGCSQSIGVQDHPRRPTVPADVWAPRMDRDTYLESVARSLIVVALPGVGGDWTWRHTEALALGACMVCPEGDYVMPGDTTGCWVTCRRDLSDLQAVASDLIGDPDRCADTGRRGRDYFDSDLTPAAMARRLVTETMET